MDIEKSLYMAEFLKLKEDLGKIDLYPVKNTLFTNLYDEFKPRQQIEEVEEIIEEIQDKTIQLVKKDDQPLFFPDLPELIKEEVEPDEIKTIKVSDEIIKGGDLTKTITFDPHYVASN